MAKIFDQLDGRIDRDVSVELEHDPLAERHAAQFAARNGLRIPRFRCRRIRANHVEAEWDLDDCLRSVQVRRVRAEIDSRMIED